MSTAKNCVLRKRGSPKINANNTGLYGDSGFEESLRGTENSTRAYAREVFKKNIFTTNGKTNDSFIDQPARSSNQLSSRPSTTKPEVVFFENSTLPTPIKTNTSLNFVLNTIKPVSKSPRIKENLKRVDKVNGNE